MSGPYLLDTNVLIHLARARGTVFQALAPYSLVSASTLSYVPVVCVGEVRSLVLRQTLGQRWGPEKRARLDAPLPKSVLMNIDHTDVLDAYAELDRYSRSLKPARPTGENDLWIAATAKVTKTILLTTDTDFDHLEGVHLKRHRIDAKTGAITKT